MRKGLLGSLAALVAGAGPPFSQAPSGNAPSPPPDAAAAGQSPVVPGGTVLDDHAPAADLLGHPAGPGPGIVGGYACPPKCPRFWVTGEYLMWRLQDAPLPVPLLTQGDAAAATAAGLTVGALTAPGTQVVSPNSFHFGNASGGRMEFGGWLDSDRWLGFQVSGFGLQRRSASFSTSSPTDVTSTTVLAVPFVIAGNGAESAIQLSHPPHPQPLSPEYGGEGLGVRGVGQLTREPLWFTVAAPSPQPLSPEYRGEGRKTAVFLFP